MRRVRASRRTRESCRAPPLVPRFPPVGSQVPPPRRCFPPRSSHRGALHPSGRVAALPPFARARALALHASPPLPAPQLPMRRHPRHARSAAAQAAGCPAEARGRPLKGYNGS
eukprot:scaffold65433_cov66-Phaeocystis_antarctica.AAC.5